MAKSGSSNLHYQNYLQLDKILSGQKPMSLEIGDEEAHDETLFIIIHQVYELWFKQILHELNSVIRLFKEEKVDESGIPVAVARLKRVIEIEKLLIDQVRILETMTPHDFLEFRNYLFPASGFQSLQFRMVETLLGLQSDKRLSYGSNNYKTPFTEEQVEVLEELEENSLFNRVEMWLERTPFLHFGDFAFLDYYEEAVISMLEEERNDIKRSNILNDESKNLRIETLEKTKQYYTTILDEGAYMQMKKEGSVRLSHKASVAALFINLYRDEPLLSQPYLLLSALLDIDELFTTWRYRHSQMVMRMLGRKMGTGGSSGYDYLHQTAVKHSIFSDFHNLSTLLIPRTKLPGLPDVVKKELSFYYSQKNEE